MIAISTNAIAGGLCTGTTCFDEGGDATKITPLPGFEVPGNEGLILPTQNVQAGIRVSPAETAALLAVHNANAKANVNRWETLVCSMRPVKGKTIEGILFRNEIPFWYNCSSK